MEVIILANINRPKQMIFRVNEKEKDDILKLISKSKLNQNEYLLRSALGKEIIVIDNLDELINQLVRIGNNLNQLTKLSHEGKIINAENELNQIKGEFEKVWQQLRQLRKKQQVKED